MKSQVAWVKNEGGGGCKLASGAEIWKNGLDLCWQKTWDKPLPAMFTGCSTHTCAPNKACVEKHNNP